MKAVATRVGLLAAFAAMVLTPALAHAASAQHNPFQGIPVAGTSTDGNAFSGTMDVLGFINDNGAIKAVGSLTGTITSAAGAATQVAGAIVSMPVTNAGAAVAPAAATQQGFGGAAAATTTACQILNLDLGPLDLNLLGLTVHLNEVVLNIAAQPGAGNLVGNLLCAVANLLNGVNLGNILGTALTNTLTTLLNNLLAAL
jgi:hypothetical protein